MKYIITDQKQHWIYSILSMIGLCLMVWEITIYRLTLINAYWLYLLIISIGTIGYIFDVKRYARTYKGGKLKMFCFLQNVVSIGFIVCSIFMITNYYARSEDERTIRAKIISVSDMVGSKRNRDKRKPLIEVEIENTTKELVFRHSAMKQLAKADSVQVVLSDGFFGFTVIKSQEIVTIK